MIPASDTQPVMLAIETSTRVCAVALYQGATCVVSAALHVEKSHARMLMPMIRDVLAWAGMSADSLDAIAVGKGPGSYTGLRVGVSTAKGLCMALHKPLLAFGSLEALAWQVRDLAQHLKADICPLIDARRMEVYCARYDASGRELNPPQAEILSPDAFVAWQSERRLLLPGDGAAKAASLFADTDQVWVMPEIQASAAYLGPRLMAAWQAGETEDLVSFEPYYLKDFVATRPRSLLQQIGRPDGTTPGD